MQYIHSYIYSNRLRIFPSLTVSSFTDGGWIPLLLTVKCHTPSRQKIVTGNGHPVKNKKWRKWGLNPRPLVYQIYPVGLPVALVKPPQRVPCCGHFRYINKTVSPLISKTWTRLIKIFQGYTITRSENLGIFLNSVVRLNLHKSVNKDKVTEVNIHITTCW